MEDKNQLNSEEMRDGFSAQATRLRTRIWQEKANSDNPYLANSIRCHGYDLGELVSERSFVDMFFLLFRGELPSTAQARLLEQLMIALINPGPRDPATKAAIITTATKTMHGNTLPIGLSTFAGSTHGAGEARSAMRFIRNNQDTPAIQAVELPKTPGFGSSYNGRDDMPARLLGLLLENEESGTAMKWAFELDEQLAEHNAGILASGLAAACLLDIGFAENQGTMLYQLIAAPGIAAHALEYMNAGPNDLPFPDDEHVIYDE